jgi:hypothetical protein
MRQRLKLGPKTKGGAPRLAFSNAALGTGSAHAAPLPARPDPGSKKSGEWQTFPGSISLTARTNDRPIFVPGPLFPGA